MSLRLTPALLISAAVLGSTACSPQNATISQGQYSAFLSITTSAVFVEGTVDVEELQNSWVWDCRVLAPTVERPEGADMSLCNDPEEGEGVKVGDTAGGIQHETWANNGGFVGIQEDLDPWRGEGVITSEGDLNVTFHHRISGSDFRFAFVIDPTFQPTECQDDGSGGIVSAPIDGDWIDNWGRVMTEPNYDGGDVEWPGQESSGTLFMLNSGSSQIDPDSQEDGDFLNYWNLSPKMEAGYARARYGAEEMFVYKSRYGTPYVYTDYNARSEEPFTEDFLFFERLNPDDFSDENYEAEIRAYEPYRVMMGEAEQIARETRDDIDALHPGNITLGKYQPAVAGNAWRKPDGFTGGFDGWGEMHYSWVRIDQDREDIVAGADLSGEFTLWFYGANSQSRVVVQGKFEIDGVKKDRWTTPNVDQDKLEENNTSICGQPPAE